MFETKIHTLYGTTLNFGHAVVLMNRNNHASMIDFIYMINSNDDWYFYYEKGTCLTEEEKIELENWFICNG